ncbi:MAG TPA: hypothetical protein VGR35_21715 [Tepidisphaeraceae bacterium]|nr:hypothetical protein [Tepidisphaeraceae bacterium]
MTSEASSPSAMAADHAPNVAIPVASNSVDREDAQPFWFPGADGLDSVSITSVPVRSSVDGTHASSPLPGTQQHPLIPLPGAAWTGMAGLLGLGAVKVLRNFRRLLA